MRDDFESQAWAESHGAFTAFFAGVVADIGIAFERLAARTYDAPWRAAQRGSPGASAPKRAA